MAKRAPLKVLAFVCCFMNADILVVVLDSFCLPAANISVAALLKGRPDCSVKSSEWEQPRDR